MRMRLLILDIPELFEYDNSLLIRKFLQVPLCLYPLKKLIESEYSFPDEIVEMVGLIFILMFFCISIVMDGCDMLQMFLERKWCFR